MIKNSKLFRALTRTRNSILKVISPPAGKHYSSDDIDKLEEDLLSADISFEIVTEILEIVKKPSKKSKIVGLQEVLTSCIQSQPAQISMDSGKTIIMIVGVNGTGKTTTVAKLANYYKKTGKNVLLIGADTYRAAAMQQLREWSKVLDIRLIYNEFSKSPASIIYDGLKSAANDSTDIVIVDTAGRLHTYSNLMIELKKMDEVLEKHFTNFNVHRAITIDAILGQNSLLQAKEFSEHIDLDSAILTKMDGTAKGGIAFSLHKTLNLPISFIGIGEGIDDIIGFDPEEYINAILGQ